MVTTAPNIESRPFLRQSGSMLEVTPDVACLQIVMVNVYLVGHPQRDGGDWVLVDAGLPMSAHRIISAAEERFGPGARPRAILLTHGHFDHVGVLRELADQWDVQIYAHPLEFPYLTGKSAYPPPDPTVGGMMARLSPLYPKGPYDVSNRLEALPQDGTVPFLPDWRWIATPGHSPGHVSFFRESDRLIIAGDAFTTQKQESLVGVITQHQEVYGPPAYFTPDWGAAAESVRKLAALEPEIGATGHGIPMRGQRLRSELHALADHFREVGMPQDGRYVRAPAVTDEQGIVYVPPPMNDPVPKVLLGAAVAAGVLGFLASRRRDD